MTSILRPFPAPAALLTVLASRLAVGGITVLLAACASFSGIHSNAQLATPGHFSSAESLPEQGGAWPSPSWAGDIGGPPLQALIDEALAGNPDLQIAAARIANARAALQAARAATLPTVGASFSSTYQRYTENGLIPPPLAGTYATDNELALNFSYDFDFWGRHAAQLRSTIALGKAVVAEQAEARLILGTAIARTWLQLGRQQAQLQLTEQQLLVREKLDQLTQQRIEAGLDAGGERQQTQLQLASLRADLAQWQEAMGLSRNQLAALLGKGPDRGRAIAAPTLPPEQALALPDQLPVALLGRRPDIVASRWRVEAAQGDIDNAKAQFYPNVDLMAFAGLSSLGWSTLLQSGSRMVGIGPAIRLPIFEGGTLRAQLQGKVAAYDGAVAQYNQALTEALHQVADQVQSLRALQDQGRERQLASSAALTTLNLARQRQRVGTANMLQVLISESAWLAQQQQVQARKADLRIGLIKALGGGFEAGSDGLLASSAAAR
ncbi:MAG TPA: efflux transporter outer membrane subunit [Burkholderiaceae bacterium]|nr:efflux transporter outer membrane subunit [Burkholderiaceae bacterium]